jgi:hypothetical protein
MRHFFALTLTLLVASQGWASTKTASNKNVVRGYGVSVTMPSSNAKPTANYGTSACSYKTGNKLTDKVGAFTKVNKIQHKIIATKSGNTTI